MARASKRTGYGKNRGALNPKDTYASNAPALPQNGDRWIDSDTVQEYVYDQPSAQWLPMFGGGYGGGSLGGLVYVDTDAVTTVSSLQTVAYVTATVLDNTASVIATACINGNASTTMTVTSYVMLNTTTVNTIVETVNAGDDYTTNIDLVIEEVPVGTNDIWVQQSASAGSWVLYASEQHLYALIFYDAVIGGVVSSGTTKGYIFAGEDASTELQDTDEYTSDTWANKSNMPSPARYQLGASNIDSIFYVYCGANASLNRSRDTDEYNPDTWTSKTDTPTPERRSIAATTILSKGYIYAGIGTTYYLDTDEYTPDTWVSKTNCPLPARILFDGETLNDIGYIFCGFNGSYHQDTDEYNPDTWTSKTNCPAPGRRSLSSFSMNNIAYIIGGFDGASYLQDTDEYNPDTWTSKTSCPAPARRLGTGTDIGNAGHYICGETPTKLQDNDEYIPDAWTSKTSAPTPARRTLASSSS